MTERKEHVHFVHRADDGRTVCEAVSYDVDFAYPCGAWVAHVYVMRGWYADMYKMYGEKKGYEVSLYREGERERVQVWLCDSFTCDHSYPEDDTWYLSRSFARKMTDVYDL